MRKSYYAQILLALVVLATLAGCGKPKADLTPTGTPVAGRGEKSPGFNLTGVDGSTISFQPTKNPNGDATLLVFWSFRWDPNVATLLARLRELHERDAPRGLAIIAISYDEEPSGLRTFLAENKTPFPVAVGVDSTYDRFEVKALPTIILVDSKGKVAERWEGHFSTEELSEKISQFLPGRTGNSGT